MIESKGGLFPDLFLNFCEIEFMLQQFFLKKDVDIDRVQFGFEFGVDYWKGFHCACVGVFPLEQRLMIFLVLLFELSLLYEFSNSFAL